MDIKHLQEIIVDALDDIKARDIVVFDTTRGTAEFDRVIIATADVARQTKAMAMNVIDKVKAAGGRIVSMEGGGSGEWVLVDCSDAVVHIMQPAARLHYNLEELWGHKKVRVLTAAEKAADAAAKVIGKAKVAKASAKPAAQVPAKKAPKKVATKSPARERTSKKAPVAKTAITKAVVKKAKVKRVAVKKVPVKKALIKTVSTKKAPAKKTPVPKAPVKKTLIKRAAARKAPAKGAPAKKTPAKKGAATPVPRKSAAKKAAKKC